jgi:hypothetical protein
MARESTDLESAMETKFRPIPITILDLFGILLPGFIWLILIDTSLEIALNRDIINSPINAWQKISSSFRGQDSWLAPLTLIIISLLIGYMLKPAAMITSELLTTYLFKFYKPTRNIPRKDMRFPFNGLFQETDYYKEVKRFIQELIRCSPDKLYGSQLFAAAKRYLRLMAPTLWEESERMEAEVRMSGAMFLACLYSSGLSAVTLLLQYAGVIRSDGHKETWCWLLLSIVTSLLLGFGFNRLRVREVAYTYTNALIASGCQQLLKPKDSRNREDSNAEGNG